MAKKLMKGCEAIGEAAIQAGCKHFFGYPITPQNEVPEYLSRRLPEVGGCYVQAESEVAASNMIQGAAAAGIRVFTTSSSPGISLMAEGMSYLAGAELPVVIVNIMRGGPGLGGILPSQSDYLQATKGAGHGDYKCPVLAPSSVQEACELMVEAFDMADAYRNPVLLVGDGMIGQMMEPVDFDKLPKPKKFDKPWATTGCKGRKPNVVTSLWLKEDDLEKLNIRLAEKYRRMEAEEVRYDTYNLDDPYDVLIVSYGTMARIAQTAVDMLKEQGISVGLVRPITLFPFPGKAIADAARKAKAVLSVEMSMGQMVEDVKLAVLGERPVHFYGRCGGVIPTPEEIIDKVRSMREEL